ncbi:phenolic glucoside malonyltransferase 1-like, partial [Triticum urartu]|uniref:phenolic glucoside malonyltransferase 1-like n=1 Tax=Triticum urartu TaxID=4572 RepID=UPI0020448A75
MEDDPASPRLRVLESAVVAPSLTPPVPETSLPLTFLDVLWLNAPGPDAGNGMTAILSNLKTSLSHALGAFYPLAGRLRLTPGTADRYELHHHPGDGVAFTVAECDVDVNELATDGPREVAKILPLVPPLPDGGAVLALQATVLRGGRGLAIGMALLHAACDGASSTRFFHTWVAASTGAGAPPPPIIDRTLVTTDPSARRLYDVFLGAVAGRAEREFVKMSTDQLLATFTLSKEDIQRVKDVVVVAADEARAAPPRCSSLVATFGFIWSCYQRAKHDDAANGGGPTYFLFTVDHRSRMKPHPVPAEYLGNCVGVALHGAPKAQLAAVGAGRPPAAG